MTLLWECAAAMKLSWPQGAVLKSHPELLAGFNAVRHMKAPPRTQNRAPPQPRDRENTRAFLFSWRTDSYPTPNSLATHHIDVCTNPYRQRSLKRK